MERFFDLETVLAVTSGGKTENTMDVYDLAWFVFDDRSMTKQEIDDTWPLLREHIIELHPFLEDISYNSYFETSYEAWLFQLRMEHGEELPIVQYGESLIPDEEKTKKSATL